MNRSLTILTLAAVFLSAAIASNAQTSAPGAKALKDMTRWEMHVEKLEALTKLLTEKLGDKPVNCVTSGNNTIEISLFDAAMTCALDETFGSRVIIMTAAELEHSNFSFGQLDGVYYWVYLPFIRQGDTKRDLTNIQAISLSIVTPAELDEAYKRANDAVRNAVR